MPDSGPTTLTLPPKPRRRRWVSPLLRRVLLINFLPLALLLATLVYLDQYQDGLLEAEVAALREQARIYAGALAQTAVQENSSGATIANRLAADCAVTRPWFTRPAFRTRALYCAQVKVNSG